MNQSFHLSGEAILIGVVSIANIGLMVTAAFYRERASTDGVDPTWRVKLGFVAVSLGLCSQVLYCLVLAAWIFDGIPLGPGNSVNHVQVGLARMGSLLSAAILLAALYGRGLRRYAGLWVGVTTWFLWGFSALGASLRSFPL